MPALNAAGGMRLIDGLLALHGGRWGVAERNAGKTVSAVLPCMGGNTAERR